MIEWLRKLLAGGKEPAEQRPDVIRRAWLLAERGEVDQAADLLKAGDDPRYRGVLALLLRKYSRLDEAIRLLEADPDADPVRLKQFVGERGAELVRLTRGRDVAVYPLEPTTYVDDLLLDGRYDDAVEKLRDSRHPADGPRLRTLLRELGRTDDLRSLAADAIRNATLRAEGRLEDLPAARPEEPERAPEVDWYQLARTAADEGRVEEAIGILQERPQLAPDLLADLLIEQGRVAEALSVLDASTQRGAPRRAARLRAEYGLVDDLRARAEAGERPSIDLLASYLGDRGELDELRRRAAGDDDFSRVFKRQLVRALGRLHQLDELARHAAAGDRLAGLTWWAAVLAASSREADADAVRAALVEHAGFSSWYDGESRTRGVINLLAEQGRLATAIAFARARVDAGDDWASAWVPRQNEDKAPALSPNDGMLATAIETAVRDLLPGHADGDEYAPTARIADGEEHATTARIADEGSSLYGDVRVSVPELGQVRISLACWSVGTDTARYFGDDPPTEAETKLPPAGTAVTNLATTVAVLDELATRLNAIDPPSPHPGGRHLTITVPLRTAPLTAVPD